MKQRFVSDKKTTLLQCLCDNIAGVPRDRIRIQIKRGEARVNGVRVTSNVALSEGDRVEIFLPEKFVPQKLAVVYEDDFIIAVDKPPFVESETMLPRLIERDKGYSVYPAHRLDTNTTGLILSAKTEEALAALVSAFKNRRIKKTYLARVFGCPKEDSGTWKACLKKESADSYCRVFADCVPGGKEIITEYEVILRGEQSVLLLHPVTGRTHQLRAHLAFAGYPIVGDDKYGDEKRNKAAGAKLQKLRAVQIEFGEMQKSLEYLSGMKITAGAGEGIFCGDEISSYLN